MGSQTFMAGGIAWQSREPPSRELLSLLAAPQRWLERPDLVLKQSPVAVIVRIPARDNGPALILKRFRPRRGWDSLKHLFRASRALREFRTAAALEQAGIPTARALAAGERRRAGRWLVHGDLVTEEIAGALTPREFWARGPGAPDRRRFVRAFAETIAQLYNAGFRHSDLNPTNFLIRLSEKDLLVWLIDLEGIARCRSASLSDVARDLRRLNRRVQAPAFTRLRFLNWFCRACRPPRRARQLARQILAGEREWEVRRFGRLRWKVRLRHLNSQARALMADPLSAFPPAVAGAASVSVPPADRDHPGFVLLRFTGDPARQIDAHTIGFTVPLIRRGRGGFMLKLTAGGQNAQSR